MFSLFLHLSIRSNDSFKRIESTRMCEGKLVKDMEHCEKEADKLDFQKQKLEKQRTLFNKNRYFSKRRKIENRRFLQRRRPSGSGAGH